MSLIDDLIEKRTNKNTPSIMSVPQNILVKEFYRDLQTLKQSEKVAEIKNGSNYKICSCNYKGIIYGDLFCSQCGAKIKWID